MRYRRSLRTILIILMSPAAVSKKSRELDTKTFPRDHRRRQEDSGCSGKESDICPRGRGECGLLCAKRRVRLTVVSKIGKEATIAIVSEGHFFGEGSLAGQLLRMGSAAAMTDCEILRVEKKTMMEALHREPKLSEMFVAYLLARNIRYEEDLVDQLFNSSEKRSGPRPFIARSFWQGGHSGNRVPKISQETLAEMVGTTRSRVSFFMNRFRKLGSFTMRAGSKAATGPQFSAQCRAARLAFPDV